MGGRRGVRRINLKKKEKEKHTQTQKRGSRRQQQPTGAESGELGGCGWKEKLPCTNYYSSIHCVSVILAGFSQSAAHQQQTGTLLPLRPSNSYISTPLSFSHISISIWTGPFFYIFIYLVYLYLLLPLLPLSPLMCVWLEANCFFSCFFFPFLSLFFIFIF